MVFFAYIAKSLASFAVKSLYRKVRKERPSELGIQEEFAISFPS